MRKNRGILYLTDPLGGDKRLHAGREINAITLVFDENERYLSQAQQALWELGKSCDWVCISARGNAAPIALSLAAQLPVDRLALSSFSLFGAQRLPREFARIRRFARRNLALVASQLLLSGVTQREARRLTRGLGSREVCMLESWNCDDLTAPWNQLCEKNLLIPGKCV